MIRSKAILLGCLLWSLWANGQEQQQLSSPWEMQPAINSTTAPDGKAWTPYNPVAGWRSFAAKLKKTNSIWLKTKVNIPSAWQGQRSVLSFDRINGNAVVFVNGQKVGERLGPYGEIEITGQAKIGQDNELLIFNTRDYTDISRQFTTDYLRYFARGPESVYGEVQMDQRALGIDAPVWLIKRATPVAIKDGWTETSFRQKKIDIDLELDAAQASHNMNFTCDIIDQKGQKVLSWNAPASNIPNGISKTKLTHRWDNPMLWELDAPYLYRAIITLSDNHGTVKDRLEFPFGFREIWTEGRQVIMNGHPIRWRIEWSNFGINKNSISLLKELGRNTIYYQSNPTGWWRSWEEVFYYKPEDLDLFDNAGIAVLLPVPCANYGRDKLLNNPAALKQYDDEVAAFIQRYRRHPSILAWCVSMNSFNPKDGIHPDTMGQRRDYDHIQSKVLGRAIEDVKKIDPTRLAYAHAEGNLGDVASANCYPNFTPVQECEDWPSYWAQHGNMPWWACEYSAVYDGSYFKGKQLLLTEYAAIYFGEDAYRRETLPQLEKTLATSLANTGHGGSIKSLLPDAPLYWDVQRLYVEGTDRAWRTWGVMGWHYFNYNVGYGDPEEFTKKRGFNVYNRYSCMDTPISGRPKWANPQFDMHSKYMQPLLVYIGGNPTHTDKTHAFYAGEKITKNLVAVWDGSTDLSLKIHWELRDSTGKSQSQGDGTVQLTGGEIKMTPLYFAAPEVKTRQEYELSVTVSGYGSESLRDIFALQVFPRQKEQVPGIRPIKYYDPQHCSPWLKTLLPQSKEYIVGQPLAANDILIVGREALKPGQKLPFSATEINNGLRVIILEQRPEVWDAMGFRTVDVAPRLVFPMQNDAPIMTGLRTEDLRYWRGTPTLLPEFKAARPVDVTVAPKSTNRHNVASTVIEIPQVTGFEPLLCCEFDLNYTPLLQWNYGKGLIIYNTLDLTDRVNSDPAATQLAKNLLQYVDAPRTATKKIFADSSTDWSQYGIEPATGDLMNAPEQSILLSNATAKKYTPSQITQFVTAGGTVIHVNAAPESLSKLGITTIPKKIYRAAKPTGELSTLPLSLLRWRDELKINAITTAAPTDEIWSDGIFMQRKIGKGKEIFLQVAPELLAGRYQNDPDKDIATRLSILRLKQLVSRIITHYGGGSSPSLADRVNKVQKGASFQRLDFWNLLGPFEGGKSNAATELKTVYPGEDAALAGDLNPNITYQRKDGKALDFRTTVTAGADGFVNIGEALKSTSANAVAYAVRTVNSSTARKAMLRIGVDYFINVYVNGVKVYTQEQVHGSPKPNVFRVMIDLKPGENVITMKVITGSKGFGFWADLSTENDTIETGNNDARELIYDQIIKIRAPYEFSYW